MQDLIPSTSTDPPGKYYKVKWTRVPDLVEKRKVLMKGGMAYVPAAEQASIVFQEFQTHLEKALEVCTCSVDRPRYTCKGLITTCRRRPRHFPGLTRTIG